MMQANTINWSVAILLSLLVHSVMFMGSGVQMGAENAAVLQAPIITRLSFNNPLEKAVLDEPQPIEKQQAKPVKKIVAKPVKKTIIKKTSVKKKPVKTKQARKEPVVRRIEPVEKVEPVRQMATAEPVRGQQVSHSSDGLLQRQRQQYLHELMSHIEAFKFYPRAARRRYLEGTVKISFRVIDDGSCEQLMLDGDHSALVKAARSALESAMPLPAPPEDIVLSEKIEFAMVYSLTD